MRFLKWIGKWAFAVAAAFVATVVFSGTSSAVPLTIFGSADPIIDDTNACGLPDAHSQANCAKAHVDDWLRHLGKPLPRQEYILNAALPEPFNVMAMGIDVDLGVLPCIYLHEALQYCPGPTDVFLSVDGVNYISGKGGPATVSLALAHESSHHLEKLAGQFNGKGSKLLENRADCGAGVFMRYMVDTGQYSFQDAQAGEGLFRFVAAPEPDMSHGTEQERVGAYWNGYNSGSLGSCGL